jgi:hypothetical protein
MKPERIRTTADLNDKSRWRMWWRKAPIVPRRRTRKHDG